MKTFAMVAVLLSCTAVPALAASKAECTRMSQKSDREMGGCRSSYMDGDMSATRKAQCCQYRLETIRTWQHCTDYFGPVDWRSLNESKREWGCG
jgi:hypothetical protein